jgi:hypothetical protein
MVLQAVQMEESFLQVMLEIVGVVAIYTPVQILAQPGQNALLKG